MNKKNKRRVFRSSLDANRIAKAGSRKSWCVELKWNGRVIPYINQLHFAFATKSGGSGGCGKSGGVVLAAGHVLL